MGARASLSLIVVGLLMPGPAAQLLALLMSDADESLSVVAVAPDSVSPSPAASCTATT